MSGYEATIYQDDYGSTYVLSSSGEMLISVINGNQTGTINIDWFHKDTNNFGISVNESEDIDVPVQEGSTANTDSETRRTFEDRENHSTQHVLNNQNIIYDATQSSASYDTNNGSHDYVFQGGNGSDRLIGGDQADHLFGMLGDDFIEGGDSLVNIDYLVGGLGSDHILGGEGDDYIWGNEIRVFDVDNTPLFYRNLGFLNTETGEYLSETAITSNYLNGGNGDDWIGGGEGNDNILGEIGADWLIGGNGSDLIQGGVGADYLFGEGYFLYTDSNGSTTPFIQYITDSEISSDINYNDVLDGGAGNDRIYGDVGNDVITGGTGDDRLFGDRQSNENEINQGNAPFVALDGSFDGNDTIFGGSGSDTIFGGGGNDTINGGTEDDLIWGDGPLNGAYHGKDIIEGGSGNDQIIGGGNDDLITGGDGEDQLWGDSTIYNDGTRPVAEQYHGADEIHGGSDIDHIYGGGSNDTLFGDEGDDFLYGDGNNIDAAFHGDDYLDGGAGNDQLLGYGGDDTLIGGEGNDLLGGDNIELALADHGNDRLFGGKGEDTLFGFGGNDYLDGGEDTDTLVGGEGDDTLIGGRGVDYLDGGEGDDTYVFNAGDSEVINGSADFIISGAGIDTLVINGVELEDLVLDYTASNKQFFVSFNNGSETIGLDSQTAVNAFNISGEEYSFNDVYLSQGNKAKNLNVSGTGENDELYGYDGNDTLAGGAGDDLISGGTGYDTLKGGDGNDTYLFSIGDDEDIIDDVSGVSDKLILGSGIVKEDIILQSQDDNLTVIYQPTNDRINILSHFNSKALESIEFENGDSWDLEDILNLTTFSTRTADNFIDSGGDDTYIVDHVGDKITENPDGGIDTVYSEISYRLNNGYIENITLTGISNNSATGNALDNILIGNVGNNYIDGEQANYPIRDYDIAYGGLGDDYYKNVEEIHEYENEGNDTLEIRDSYYLTTLPDNVENFLIYSGYIHNQTWTGNSLDNYIGLNNRGNDILKGGAGNDTLVADMGGRDLPASLYGESGNDKLYATTAGKHYLSGGTGDDIYNLKINTGGLIRDSSGYDIIKYDANVKREDIQINFDGSDILLQHGIGYYADTIRIEGGVDEQVIDELQFADGTVVKWKEMIFNIAPTVSQGIENQIVDEDSIMKFTIPDDAFSDLNGNDLTYTATLIDGGELPSWLAFNGKKFTGTPTNSEVGNLEIKVTASDGRESVSTDFQLEIIDTAELPPTVINGNDDPNTITGTKGHDVIYGFLGNDRLSGGNGDDELFGGEGNDDLYGNSEEDKLFGENGDDTLRGDDGHDILDGGDGDDDLWGGDGNDILRGGPGDDTLYGAEGNDIYLYGRGDENANIHNNDLDTSSLNSVRFLENISPEDISVSEDSYENLVLRVSGNSGRITVFDHFSSQAYFYGLELIEFENGVTWNLQDADVMSRLLSNSNNAPEIAHLINDQEALEDLPFEFILPNSIFEDLDGDALSYSASLVNGDGLPAWLSFDGSSFNGTPDASYSTIQIQVTAFDGISTASTTFSISPASSNASPVAIDDVASTNEDLEVTINVLLNDGDPDNDVLSVSSASASNGSVTINPDGTLNYSPNANFNGSDSINYEVSDGNGGSAISTVMVTVNPENDAPTLLNKIINQELTEGELFNFDIPIGSFSDVDSGDLLSYVANLEDGSALPAWLSFNSGVLGFAGTPGSSDVGSLSVKVTVSDLSGATSDDTFNLTIAAAEDLPMNLTGTSSADVLHGGSANDYINAKGGKDKLFGYQGKDTLIGSGGSDTLYGGDGVDKLKGGGGNDHLYGEAGNDVLIGGAGNDTYYFASGEGFDRINNASNKFATETDSLNFSGVTEDDIWFKKTNNHLDIYLLGSSDRVRVNNWYKAEKYELDRIDIGGSSIDSTGIEQLVNAMAGFGAPSGGSISLSEDQKQQVNTAIAASWQ